MYERIEEPIEINTKGKDFIVVMWDWNAVVGEGLLQISSGWATGINTRTTATGDARSCSTCMRPFTKRSRDIGTQISLSRWLNSSSACLSIRPSMDEHLPTSTPWFKWRRPYQAELRITRAWPNFEPLCRQEWHSYWADETETWRTCLLCGCTTHLKSAANRYLSCYRHSSLQTKIENAFVLGSLPGVKLMIRRIR